MKLFWKLSGLTLLVCGTLMSGCASSPDNPVFSENPVTPSPTMTGSPGDVASSETDAARFNVGETVSVTFSGIASDELLQMPASTQIIKEDGSITLPYIGFVK